MLASVIPAAQRWVLWAAAVALPLAYWPLTFDRYVLPKLLLARFFVLVLGVLLAGRMLVSGAVSIRRTPLDLPLLAFLASALLSAFAGVNLNVGLFGTYTRYDGVLTLLTYVALFWLAVQSIPPGGAKSLFRALLLGGYLVAVVAIVLWTVDTLGGQPVPRAYGSLGNPNTLGAYLVMLLPVAYEELLAARSTGARLLAAMVMLTLGLALLLSVSYSAWLGVLAAAVVLLFGRQLPALRSLRRQMVAGAVGLAVVAAAVPVALTRSTDVQQRLHIWKDTLGLIASRPLLGYGPDTFGLVYPGFQSGKWVIYLQIDKAHSELLQVAATQGLVGLAAFLWVLAAFVPALWRGRTLPGAWGAFAGWVAYLVVLLFNFTALAAAFPFWIFAAGAMVQWNATTLAEPRVARKPLTAGALAAALVLVALAVPAVVMPYLADASLQQAVSADLAGRPYSVAHASAAQARSLMPQESVYAEEVGNIEYEHGNWSAARQAYLDAVWLGTFNTRVYWHLALADRQLGLLDEAVAAARQAVYLDRWDPANQALLAQMLDARNH